MGAVLVADDLDDRGDARSLTAATYGRLKSDIVACNLRPGDRLKIMDLSAAYGCSPGAVREALTRLAAEELVVAEEQRGFRVKAVSRRDLLDLTRTRIDVESLTLRYAIANSSVDCQSEIVAALFKLSQTPILKENGEIDARWDARHLEFHMALISACDSPRLLSLCRAYFHQSQRFRMLTLRCFPQARSVDSEHNELAGAVLARDPERAVRILTEHYTRTTDLILRLDKAEGTSILGE